MKTGQEYIESLRQLKMEIYFMGEKIDSPVDNPYIRPHINSAAFTYDAAHDPEFADLGSAESNLTGERINRFTPLVRKYFRGVAGVSTENRIRVARLIENMTGGTALAESMHGAGSPQAQRVMLLRDANLEHLKRLAQKLCGVSPEE